MYLKFEKNKIRCRVSQIEAAGLLAKQALTDKVQFPSGHIFIYRVEASELSQNIVSYVNSTLTFQMTKASIEGLMANPTKDGITFLQDKVAYAFEIDVRKERRKKIRKI